jgi:thioredoxin 1
MSENVIVLTDENFEDTVTGAQTPVLVDFWAEWCMPCKMLAPTIAEIADDYVGKLVVAKVSTDDAHQAAVKLGITSIPTVIIFKGGQMVKRFVGLQQKADLAAAIDEVLAE